MNEGVPQDSVFRDSLTGVFTRAAFESRLRDETANAERLEQPLSLLVLDIDHFKSVNDGFGHARGDAVLAEIGRRLQSSIRTSDSVYRYGGDEFVVLLPKTALAQAIQAAQRLLTAVNAKLFVGEPPLNLSISVGVAVFPVDGSTPEALFLAADQRLYQAKRSGRAQMVDQNSSSGEPIALVTRLIERDKALETIQTFIDQAAYQPYSVLRLKGSAESGLTRLLEEVGQAARMHNMATLHIQCTPALGMRLYGALLEARHSRGDLPDPALGVENYAAALWQACSQVSVLDRSLGALVILIDTPINLDRLSLEFLTRLYFSEPLAHLALVYTETETQPTPHFNALEPQITLAAVPLSQEGVRVWLRFHLQWEAPPEFTVWLHRQTGGLPARIERSINCLIETHVLQNVHGKWGCQIGYERSPLTELLARPDVPPCHLPVGLMPFVGRHTNLRALKQIIQQERLISLVGPGGLGKSRLAIQLAAESLSNFPQGVFFVPLVGLQSASQLLPAMAEALQIQFPGRKDPKQEFLHYCQSRRMLLVLDNFEQLREGANLLLEILEHAPGLSLLVTSRDPLNLPGERLFELENLSYPLSDASENIEGYESVQLFLQAARQRLPDFALGESERYPLVRICRLVEGNPLGLELAAAWVRVIPPHEIALEIERNLSFLATDHPEVEPRHRSLQAVLDSFWEMLTELEQDLICQLSVFASGFQQEAAHAVVKVSALFLDALIAKAYLRVDPQGRYQMHEMLRQYATNKLVLKPALESATQEQHARFYLEWVNMHENSLEDDRRTTTMMGKDLDNIRLAWGWATEHDRLNLLRSAMNGLKTYLDGSSRWDDGRQIFAPTSRLLEERSNTVGLDPDSEILWLQLRQAEGSFLKCLTRLDEAQKVLEDVQAHWIQLNNPVGLSRTLLELGDVYLYLGDLTNAQRLLEEDLELTRALADSPGMINVLISLVRLAIDQINYQAAQKMLDECLSISRALGKRAKTARVLNLRGITCAEQGDWATAQTSYTESLKIYQELGDRQGVTWVLNNQGNAALDTKQADEAQRKYEDSLFMAREIGDIMSEAISLNNLGILANERGDVFSAKALNEDALKLHRVSGYKHGLVSTLDNLGVIAIEQKDYVTARRCYGEYLTLASETGYKRMIPFGLVGFACLACEDEGRFQRTVRLLAAVESFQTRYTIVLEAVTQRMQERILEKARTALPQADFDTAWSEGLALTDEQAVALALQNESIERE